VPHAEPDGFGSLEEAPDHLLSNPHASVAKASCFYQERDNRMSNKSMIIGAEEEPGSPD
jgi:hypothetical protein